MAMVESAVESHSNEHVDIVRSYDSATSWIAVNKRPARCGGENQLGSHFISRVFLKTFTATLSYFAHALHTRGNSTSLPA